MPALKLNIKQIKTAPLEEEKTPGTSRPTPQKKYSFKFKELVDQDEAKKYTCNASGYLVGQNQSKSSVFFKKIFCGKEWCPCCGDNMSIAHGRRISRVYDKMMNLGTLGYLVVTTPQSLRKEFLNVEILKDFKNYIKRKLKRDFPGSAGIIRYHWAGDDETTYKPHINVLFNHAWIEAHDLENFRHDLKFWFKKTFKLSEEETPEANIYYNYTSDPAKKFHRIKYITRATLRNFESQELKDFFYKDMKNFKNTLLFGTFEKSAEPLKDAAAKVYNKNICPYTNEPILWDSYARNIDEIVHKNFRNDLGLGIIHAYRCYTKLKENEKISFLGRTKKLSMLKAKEPPGYFFEAIRKRDKLNTMIWSATDFYLDIWK